MPCCVVVCRLLRKHLYILIKTTIIQENFLILYHIIKKVVRLIKKSKNKPITAAIGDGANDISMIQEAHVGLGIFGKEGNNAAKSADFSFAKFKFLKRILINHGYIYYCRTAILIQYFFYKVKSSIKITRNFISIILV